MRFEWDSAKAARNLAKHGISFDQASTVFGDPLAVTIADPDHSADEDRFLTTGFSSAQRLLVVSHVYREGAIRIIMARDISGLERQQYESKE
jgi:uncharacterized protein